MSFKRAPSVSLVAFVVVVAALFSVISCDPSFEIFEESDLAYSVFGILDASADTQFVRVEPVQDTALAGIGSIDARVTSENLATGETAVWHDSTFFIGATGVAVHNFWTAAAGIEPEGTYRFTVQRESDGASSAAEVTLPPAFPKPEVAGGRPALPQATCGETAAPTTITVEGVERLGGVRVDYDYLTCVCGPDPGCRRRRTTTYPLAGATRTGEGAWQIKVFWSDDIPGLQGFRVTEVYSFRVTVASVSEDWPETEGRLPPGDPTQPFPPLGGPSNVDSGLGFLGGAVTRFVDVPIVYPDR